MAGSLVNEYSVGDPNLSSLMTTTDKSRIGYHAVSLTHYSDSTVPAIAAGSKIEVNGALYEFETDEAIGGSPSDGTVYIKLIPSGATCTAEFTNTAPIWDTEKQGWYSPTGGEESYRYLEFGMTKASAAYSNKYYIRKYLNDKVFIDVYRAGSGYDTTGDGVLTQITFDTEVLDTHSSFSSNTFTAPIHGYYNISYHGYGLTQSGLGKYRVDIYKNDVSIATYENLDRDGNTEGYNAEIGVSYTHVALLNAGDTIKFYGAVSGTIRRIFGSRAIIYRIS